MIKIHNYELLQHFTHPEPNSVNSAFCNSVYFVDIYFSHFFFPVHPILFSMKVHSKVFFVCFFLLYLINLFLFLFLYLFKHIINHTKFLQINVLHSSVYIGMLFHLYIFFAMLCVCLFS